MKVSELTVADLLKYYKNNCKGCPFNNTNVCTMAYEDEPDWGDGSYFDGFCTRLDDKILNKEVATSWKDYSVEQEVTEKQKKALELCEYYFPKFTGTTLGELHVYLNKYLEQAAKKQHEAYRQAYYHRFDGIDDDDAMAMGLNSDDFH